MIRLFYVAFAIFAMLSLQSPNGQGTLISPNLNPLKIVQYEKFVFIG